MNFQLKRNVELKRDVLQLIAEKIDNRKTFFNFAICNRHTAQISKLLKKVKEKEFGPKLEFWFNKDPSLLLPIAALSYSPVVINVDFEPLSNI